MKLIDLSMPIYPGMPVFPGDAGVSYEQTNTHKEHGFATTRLCFSTHTGTHLDAPAHFIEDGPTVDQLDLSAVVGPALCIETGLSQKGVRPTVVLPNRALRDVRPGDFLILSTGWAQYANTLAYYKNYPSFSAATIKLFLEKKIRLLGVDLPSVQIGDDPFEAHQVLLGNDIVLVENLVFLSSLIGRRFIFSAAPLLLSGADGASVRAYAMVENEKNR